MRMCVCVRVCVCECVCVCYHPLAMPCSDTNRDQYSPCLSCPSFLHQSLHATACSYPWRPSPPVLTVSVLSFLFASKSSRNCLLLSLEAFTPFHPVHILGRRRAGLNHLVQLPVCIKIFTPSLPILGGLHPLPTYM